MKQGAMRLWMAVWLATLSGWALGWDEFEVKREEVFEFAAAPTVVREGDRTTVSFETKGFCDVTVAVEDERGRIVRHLASGVLGPNAPEPLQPNARRQAVVWDGKDDRGVYVDDANAHSVRVSLGLRPQFERTLYWSPKKRITPGNRPTFASGPEGVYVHEGGGVDHIRLFDHAGEYVRTVYPFPPDYSSPEARAGGPGYLERALAGVEGLQWMEFPQDGQRLPVWHGVVQATLLTSGDNTGHHGMSKYGSAASAMALHGNRLALVMRSLNRLATDGTTGGLPLDGPATLATQGSGERKVEGVPRSAAFSPDGQWVYLTGYRLYDSHRRQLHWLPGVLRVKYDGDQPPEVFAGSGVAGEEGTADGQFRCPTSVAVDRQGRVYVADMMNNRIQVFDPDGSHLASLGPVNMPVTVAVHPESGHIYTASWLLVTRHHNDENCKIEPTLTRFGPLDDFRELARYPLELAGYHRGLFMNRTGGVQHEVFVDFHADEPVVWVVPGTGDTQEKLMQLRRAYSPGQWQASAWAACHYRLYVERDGKLEEIANFARDAGEAVTRIDPPSSPSGHRQRLFVNPRDGQLFVAESKGQGVGKAFNELSVIDPASGQVRIMKLPVVAEDMDFDMDGNIYLRTDLEVARFDPSGRHEIPWDYGEMRERVGFDGHGPALLSVLPLPGTGRPGNFHLGGFGVSPQGHVAVSTFNRQRLDVVIAGGFSRKFQDGRRYEPPMYPGRARWGEVHVWDRHGKLIREDAVGGLPMTDGLLIDRHGDLYALVAANRMRNGVEYPLERSATLMKFPADKGKIVSAKRDVPVPVDDSRRAGGGFDIVKGVAGSAWVEGAEWMYGGVGLAGFNSSKGGGGCACWNARFALDLFARSFATELNRFTVAVLDTNGNLILRVGKYGNVDDGRPLVLEGGPANPRSIGGDEVALSHASYVATHSDRRLFIADYGNYRILSVKLGYHTEQSVPLATVPDRAVK